jgi:HEAT repeat protein
VQQEDERPDPPRPRATSTAARDANDPSAADDELPSTPRGLTDLLLGDTLSVDEIDGVREALAAHGATGLPELIRLVASERHAAWACVRLQELGAAAAPAAQVLARCLVEDRAVGPAAQALVAIGAAGAAAVLPLLASDDPDVRAVALDTIGRIGAVPREGEPLLFRAASDGDEVVRCRAAFALRAVEADRPRVVETLVRMLGDEARDVRHAALHTLRELVDLLEARTGTLVAHAERRPDDLLDVMHLLREIGPTATMEALRSPVAELRATAARYADVEDAAVRARLVELLDDEDAGVSIASLVSLSCLDEPPVPAVRRAAAILADQSRPVLSGDLRAPYDEVAKRRAAATIAVAQVLRGAAPLDTLLPSLADRQGDVRVTAARALLRVAPATDLPRVLDAVRPLWHDEGLPDDLRVEIAAEVGVRQGAGTEVVPWLAKYAESGAVLRVESLAALGRIADPRATEVLLGQLDVVIWEVRVAAIAALGGQVESDPRVSVALVEQLRKGPRGEVREAAATALARVHSRPEVRAALEAAKLDRVPAVRAAAKAALGE